MRRAWLWLPPLLYMVMIFYLSSETAPLPELTARVWDKALHFPEYLGLSLLLARAFYGEGLPPVRAALFALLLASAYGVSDEIHQSFVPKRTADVYDWIADTCGAATAASAFSTVLRRRHRPPRSQPGRLDRPTGSAVPAVHPSASGDR
jgi:VanZ family protein